MSSFVLERKYALQLPVSYVDVDEQEMEYIDGGWWFQWNSVTVIGAILDGTLALFSWGWALMSSYALKKFINQNRKKAIEVVYRTLMRHVGNVAASWASTTVNVMLSYSGSGMGTWLAKVVDYLEGNWGYTSNNGILFG